MFDVDWPRSVLDPLLAKLEPSLLVVHAAADFAPIEQIRCDPWSPPGDLGDKHTTEATVEARQPVDDGDIFYTGFTSGSSGQPKGFARSRHSWLESFRNDQIECPLSSDDVVAAPGNLSHSLYLYALVRALHSGAAVVLLKRFAVSRLVRALDQLGSVLRP